MKVLYDFRAYQIYKQRGVGRYVYHMFESAIRQNDAPAYILLFKNDVQPQFCSKVSQKISYRYQEAFQLGQYKNETYDVFINGGFFIPSSGARGIIDILYPPEVMCAAHKATSINYDFMPLFFQQCIPTKNWKIAYALIIEVFRYLDHIFTDSMFSLYSGVRYLNRPASDFTCLYGGANEEKFLSTNSSRPYEAAERGNHLVYVGGDAPYKNTEGIVRAFCQAYKRGWIPNDAKLYIVCSASDQFINMVRTETLQSGCEYRQQVQATGYITDTAMIHLISTARSSIFPSFYEGLGLPILESYAAGTPCWASGVSATKELVLPECSFDPFDEESMIQAITSIYQHKELCKNSLEFGRKLLREMNWDTGARKMLDTCKRLCGEGY